MTNRIDDMVRARRAALDDLAADDDRWGLALSGGGIRSATFCFGLLHALARRGILLRFDLLSTVSGGGYIGAMLGRLLQRARNAGEVREIVRVLGEGNTSWFSWWLRANGRYLVPRGISDTISAFAVYLRNIIGVHVELGIAGLLLGASLAVLNLGIWTLLARIARDRWPDWLESSRDWLAWLPTLWLLLVPLAFAALVVVVVYWAVPLVAKRSAGLLGFAIAAAASLALSYWREPFVGAKDVAGSAARDLLWIVCFSVGIAWICALPVALLLNRQTTRTNGVQPHRPGGTMLRSLREAMAEQASTDAQDEARNRSTKWLATLLQAMAIVLLLGVLDRSAWWLAFDSGDWVRTGVWLAAAAAVLRALLPFVSSLQSGSAGTAGLLAVGNLAGRVLTFCVFAWWIAVVQKTALGSMFKTTDQLDLKAAWIPVAVIFGGALAYALLTGWNVRFLNLSSLHGFYRSRLVRSYLGASNPARFFGDAAVPPLGAASSLPADPHLHGIKKIWEVHRDDDVPIGSYLPHTHGGPVHLINACLNETRDPSSGLFNKDRRGRLVTIAPGGLLRVSRQPWHELAPSPGSLTLGSWTAISGAALAPGLGSLTRGGISALTMFAGARLGFWWDSSVLRDDKSRVRLQPAKLWGVLDETRGVFSGMEQRDWFLTDGGHFENTGAYALLAERCKLIMLADCGADPQYRFRDLENLVRKARIDLRADIEFLRPDVALMAPAPASPPAGPPGPPQVDGRSLLAMFGSLNDLASNTSRACYALARVTYRDEGPDGKTVEHIGHLVLVKPNLFGGLPVDLFNFKAEHPQFPQQGTADQFFDEAQWESYFQLGKGMGEPLRLDSLTLLVRHAGQWFTDDDGSPIDKETAAATPPDADAMPLAAPGKAARPAAEGRLPARIAASAVTAASVGLGAAATAGVAAWQAIDSVRKSSEEQTKAERSALKELTDLWAKLQADGSKTTTPGELAAALARVSDTLCPSNEAGWFNQSALAVDILQSARHVCSIPGENSMACNWLLNASDPFAAGPRASCLAAGSVLAEQRYASTSCTQYWGWDYRSSALPRCAHPNDPLAVARRADVRRRLLEYSVEVFAADAAPQSERRPSDAEPCAGLTVYPMLYGRGEQQRVGTYLPAWRGIGARMAATEDVNARAAMERLARPLPFAVTRVRYHEGTSRQCALQLVGAAAVVDPGKAETTRTWQIEAATPLSPAKPGGIEVWIVAQPAPAASAPSAPASAVPPPPPPPPPPSPPPPPPPPPPAPPQPPTVLPPLSPVAAPASAPAATTTTTVTTVTTTTTASTGPSAPQPATPAGAAIPVFRVEPCQPTACETRCNKPPAKNATAGPRKTAAGPPPAPPTLRTDCPDQRVQARDGSAVAKE